MPFYVEHERVHTSVGSESRTKQSPQEENDLNAIMRKYLATGHMPVGQTARAPRYGDFSEADDYLSAVNRVREAQAAFAELPAPVRDHVKNDPTELLRLVFDPARVEEARQLELVPQPEVDQVEVPAAPAPAPAPVEPAAPVPSQPPLIPQGGE